LSLFPRSNQPLDIGRSPAALGALIIFMLGGTGLFWWAATSVCAWVAKIVGEDVRDSYRGVMRDDEYRDDHRD